MEEADPEGHSSSAPRRAAAESRQAGRGGLEGLRQQAGVQGSRLREEEECRPFHPNYARA